MAIHTLSLCSGVGMLDLGLRIAGDFRTVCYVEREAFAASQLVALMEAGCLDVAPVYADLSTFDGRPWRGKVDWLIGGLPCQPYSVAGKRIGNEDKRSWGDGDGPIPHAIRIIGEVDPAVVCFENVPAWVTGGFFQPVAEALSAMGYRVEKPLFIAAEDVGASHKRERVFVMAHREGRGFGELRQSSGRDGFTDGQRPEMEHAHRDGRSTRTVAGSAGETVCDNTQGADKCSDSARASGADELAHPESQRLGEAGRSSERPEERASRASDVADTEGRRGRVWLGHEQPRRSEIESAGSDVEHTASPRSTGRQDARADTSDAPEDGSGGKESCGGCSAVADAGHQRMRRSTGRGETFSGWTQFEVTGPSALMADTSSTRPQGGELSRSRISHGGGAGNTWTN